MRHHYFVSCVYKSKKDDTTQHVTASLELSHPITDMKTIREYEASIEQSKGYKSVIVTFYQLLRVEEELKDSSKFRIGD